MIEKFPTEDETNPVRKKINEIIDILEPITRREYKVPPHFEIGEKDQEKIEELGDKPMPLKAPQPDWRPHDFLDPKKYWVDPFGITRSLDEVPKKYLREQEEVSMLEETDVDLNHENSNP